MMWDKIEAVMMEQRVTQYDLAQRMNIQSCRITKLKTGAIKWPRLKFVCQIANALNVPVEVFKLDDVVE